MREQRFGVEIEMTGITREKASQVAAGFLGGESRYIGTYYNTFTATDRQGRVWKFTSDSSINAQKREHGRKVPAGDEYKTELVTPICRYEDIPVIQELVRRLRREGGFSNPSCGIHIHVDALPFDARTLRNLTNIMYSKEDILYKALQVDVAREYRYCMKTDQRFLDELNRRKPKSIEELKRVWYGDGDSHTGHYDESRYHCVNLHSVFQTGTVEFRLFNSTVEHAGKIKAYIQLCLAITAQALNQRCASRIKTQTTNEAYTFRTWLLRLGMIGDEFKTARKHLLEHLEGGIAWRGPTQAERQRERLQAQRQQVQESDPFEPADYNESEQEDEDIDQGPTLSM